jgi:threonine dehydratase
MTHLSLSGIHAAHEAMSPFVWRTPLLRSHALNRASGGPVHLKLECWQRTGSFKVRGALNRMAALSPRERAQGVVTASAGNHGLGVALAAQVLGIESATVFVPETVSEIKLAHLLASGCAVRRAGADYDAAHALAVAFAEETGAAYISAFDDPLVIAGQATVGLEIVDDLPELDVLLVPVGGGGLLAGVAAAVKAIRPSVRIFGVEPDASPAAHLSLRDGIVREVFPSSPTICDGLAGGIGRAPFEIYRSLVEDILIAPEASVRHAVAWLLYHEQLVTEGSAAIAIAPLLSGALPVCGLHVAAILTGRNIDAGLLTTILQEHPAP